ncbi:hypothetical protein D3C80_2104330 [compost metagenome]
MFRRFGFIVVEAGADDGLCILRRDDLGAEPFEQRQIAFGADEEDLLVGSSDQRAGHIA